MNRERILIALIAGIALQGAALAQHEHTTPAGAVQRFACENDGLIGGAPFGCQLLVRSTVAAFPEGQLFWHLRSFQTLTEAERARAPQDVTAAAGGQAWLFSFGPGSQERAGRLVGRVGPLPVSRTGPFQIQLWYVVMPPGTSTGSHQHPGPEAWYVLEGEQCEQRDMRDLPWPGRFDGAFCVGNSFGYLDDEGNAAFLRAIRAALKPGGRFVLETPMVLENLLNHLHARPWWKAGDVYLLVENQYDPARARLDIEYTFASNGRVEVRRGSHRAYTYRELVELLTTSGFAVEPTEPWTRDAHSVSFIATRI